VTYSDEYRRTHLLKARSKYTLVCVRQDTAVIKALSWLARKYGLAREERGLKRRSPSVMDPVENLKTSQTPSIRARVSIPMIG